MVSSPAGDCHATQGDGEVCGTGIEMEAFVTLRFDLRKGENLPELRYRMSGAMTATWNTAGWYCTTGHGPTSGSTPRMRSAI